jgi:hypothetical protein
MYDEPHMTTANYDDKGNPKTWTCRCEVCQKLFEERYGRKMPEIYDADVEDFRIWTFTNYFNQVCGYATAKGITDIEGEVRKAVDAFNETQPPYRVIKQVTVRDTEFEKTTSKKIKRKYNVGTNIGK